MPASETNGDSIRIPQRGIFTFVLCAFVLMRVKCRLQEKRLLRIGHKDFAFENGNSSTFTVSEESLQESSQKQWAGAYELSHSIQPISGGFCARVSHTIHGIAFWEVRRDPCSLCYKQRGIQPIAVMRGTPHLNLFHSSGLHVCL